MCINDAGPKVNEGGQEETAQLPPSGSVSLDLGACCLSLRLPPLGEVVPLRPALNTPRQAPNTSFWNTPLVDSTLIAVKKHSDYATFTIRSKKIKIFNISHETCVWSIKFEYSSHINPSINYQLDIQIPLLKRCLMSTQFSVNLI
jgi:hypothetical protein